MTADHIDDPLEPNDDKIQTNAPEDHALPGQEPADAVPQSDDSIPETSDDYLYRAAGDSLTYEDLGIQFGLNRNKTGKEAHLELLNKRTAALKHDHEALCQGLEKAAEQYANRLKKLVEIDLLEHIARIDEQKTRSVQRLIAHHEALRQVLRHAEDKEQRQKILDGALREISSILQEAHEALADFKAELRGFLQPEKLQSLLREQLDFQRDRMEEFRQQFEYEYSLERGYAYGESVSNLLNADWKDNT